MAVVALAQNQLGMADVQAGVKSSTCGSLHAMVRPEDLPAIGDVDRFEGLLAGMRRCKRQMPARMPVLRKHYVREFGRQGIDQGHNLVATRYGEAAAWTEIVLDVDNEKHIVLADSQIFFQIQILSFSAKQLFDHLVGELEKGARNLEAKRFGRL